MKIGLVGYQGGGKSTLFELLTGVQSDPAKVQGGQAGMATLPDERFDRLVELFHPKKITPAKIELFDTPGLSRDRHEANPQRLAVIREATALVQVIGAFAGDDPLVDIEAFQDDLVLADLQVVEGRIKRLKKDVLKPRPDRDQLHAELEALAPIAAKLEAGEPIGDMPLDKLQEKAASSFSLLTRKSRLIVLNTAESETDAAVSGRLEAEGHRVVSAPVGLELEVQALPEDERALFAAEMGLGEPCRSRLLRSIYEVTDLITFYTCNEKEVHAWLLKRGSTAVEAADSIHSDLARGFIRVEVQQVADLLRLGSEREVKAAGLHHVQGKDYIVKDGDEMLVRFSV